MMGFGDECTPVVRDARPARSNLNHLLRVLERIEKAAQSRRESAAAPALGETFKPPECGFKNDQPLGAV